ncbi:MAG: hypothetical protein ACI4LK_02420 [Lentihominibacter sp.]
MKPEEAIENIEGVLWGERLDPEAYELAEYALEKQTPKRIDPDDVHICPGCGFYIGWIVERSVEVYISDECYRINYCPNCGHALDWR